MSNSDKNSEAMSRLTALFDDGIFTEIDAYAKDSQGDIEVVAGFGTVSGTPVYAFSQDASINDGAIGIAQCTKILKVYSLAAKTGSPVVGIYNSNGVKLDEGFEALSLYGEVVKAATSVSGVVPQISIIAGACLGTSALIANTADVIVAVKDADFYVTVPSDITAEDSFNSGAVDILADDFTQAVNNVKKLLLLLPANNLSPAPLFDFEEPSALCAAGMSAKDIIFAAADNGLVVELKAGYAKNAVTALASVAGTTVGFAAIDGDVICPDCSEKTESLIKLCDAYNIPIVTIVNTKGMDSVDPVKTLKAATKLISAYATATCPKISIISEQAIGASYIILAGKGANADITYAWDTSVVSPLDVEASVAFLYNDRLSAGEDRAALENEYKQTVGSAYTAAACGAVDDVFAPDLTRAKLIAALDMLSGKREMTIARKHSVK